MGNDEYLRLKKHVIDVLTKTADFVSRDDILGAYSFASQDNSCTEEDGFFCDAEIEFSQGGMHHISLGDVMNSLLDLMGDDK